MKNIVEKITIGTLYSIISFCVISYISVMVSLFQTIGTNQRPVCNIGFPLKYYYQFWLSGNDGPNCGWRVGNFLLDYFLVWIVTVLLYLTFKEKKPS